MSVKLDATQQVPLTAVFKDKAGNAATLSGVPTWASSDETIVTLTPAADGLSATAATVGALGTATVTASIDGVSASIDIEVDAGVAATAEIDAGTPEAKPDAAAAPAAETPAA